MIRLTGNGSTLGYNLSISVTIIGSYLEVFTSSQANLIVLKIFLHDEVALDLSKFINDEAELETLYGLYSAMEKNPNAIANVTETEWTEAEEQDRFLIRMFF